MLNKENIDKKSNEQHIKRIRVIFTRVCLLAMLLIFSTYAWFTSQKDITLSNIRGTVEVVENMEISLDAKNWYQQIDLTNAELLFENAQNSRDTALGETENNTKSTALAIVPRQLLPVSGIGEIGETLMPLYVGEATSTSLSAIEKCVEEEINSYTNKEVAKDNGYFAFDIYIKNTSRDNENDVLQLNLNSVAQVLTETIQKTLIDEEGNEVERQYIGNADSGLQNTIRVGLALYNGATASTATQLEILNSTKDKTIKDLAIWEPNAYDHVESVVANNNRLINETEANKIPFENGVSLQTYALSSAAVTAGEITNVYNIKSTGLDLQNTLKTNNVKNAEGEVVDYGIYTEDLKPIDIINISGNKFELGANTVNRLRVYVWLEGQDIDCINIASLGGGLELDLGLTKDNEVGDGGGSRLLAEVDYDLTEVVNGEVTATITANREIELPAGWSYAVTEAVAVASTENVKIATATPNKNSISRVYSSNTEELVELNDLEGNTTVVKVKIESLEEEGLVNLVTKANENKAKVYGKYTDYPIDIDGNANNNDWRIFYSDDTNVFLIADDNVPVSMIPMSELELFKSGSYGVYWSDVNTYEISGSNKYMISRASEFSVNTGYKATGSLLDTSKWNETFVNNIYADDAIGSPTIEMWMASWNSLYNSTDYPNQQLYCNAINTYGYFVGSESEPNTKSIDISTGFNGYSNSLYFPENISGGDGYWIASPPAGNETSSWWSLLAIKASGSVNYVEIGPFPKGGVPDPKLGDSFGVRPVVCLDSAVKAIKENDVWKLDGSDVIIEEPEEPEEDSGGSSGGGGSLPEKT